MNYDIAILRRAQKELAELSTGVYERVRNNIGALAQEPKPPSYVRLTNWEGWRIRVGDYRVIYEIDDQQKITILNIGHRRDVYR